MYLLSSIEPNSEIVGGMWEKDADEFEIMNGLMNKVFDHICHAMSNGAHGITLREIITFMKSEGMDLDSSSGQDFKDDDLKRMIDVMVFDQRLELTNDNLYKAVNYQFPSTLNCFADEDDNLIKPSSRILFTEVPVSHYPEFSWTPDKTLIMNVW